MKICLQKVFNKHITFLILNVEKLCNVDNIYRINSHPSSLFHRELPKCGYGGGGGCESVVGRGVSWNFYSNILNPKNHFCVSQI